MEPAGIVSRYCATAGHRPNFLHRIVGWKKDRLSFPCPSQFEAFNGISRVEFLSGRICVQISGRGTDAPLQNATTARKHILCTVTPAHALVWFELT